MSRSPETLAPETLLAAFESVIVRYGLGVTSIEEDRWSSRVVLSNTTSFLSLEVDRKDEALRVYTGRLDSDGNVPADPLFAEDGWVWFELALVLQVTTGKRQHKLSRLRSATRMDKVREKAAELAVLTDSQFGPVLAGDTARLDEWEAMLRQDAGIT